MLKRFEKGDKFVELAVTGRTQTTRAGKVGTDGKLTKQVFPSSRLGTNDALRAAERYVKTGWKVVSLEPVPCAPTVAFPREPRLEAAIRADRDDPAAYQVYADWLQGQGSPLGELIALQHAARPRTKRRADAILAGLGMPPPDRATAGWRWGLWEWLRIENGRDWMDAEFDARALAAVLFASPMCAALAELRIGVLRWEYLGDAEAVIDEAARHAWAKDLARLHVGDVSDDIDMAHHVIGDVGKRIAKAFPRLRTLKLHSGSQSWHDGRESFGVKGLALPELTELVVETSALTKSRCKAIAGAALPALEHLELWFGAASQGATAKLADVQPILAGTAFPKLTRLGLRNTELADALAAAVPGSAIAARLTSLDLSMGTLSDDGAAALAAGAKAFPKLQSLDVSDDYLTRGVGVLKKAFPKVISRDQKDIDADDPTWRYVSVEE